MKRCSTKAEDRKEQDRSRSDRGMSFVEVLVAIVLLGTAVIATLTAVRASVIGTTIERDHSKAQQWLQSSVGVIEAYDFADCSTVTLSGAAIESAYQSAIDDPVSGAKTPYGFDDGQIDVAIPEVWDGTRYVDFGSQTQCLDDDLLRQQLVTIEVQSPDGRIIESVQMVKRDRT